MDYYDSDDAGCLKSDGSNYLLWSYMMRIELEGELWDYVSGSATRPGPKDSNYLNLLRQWESKNASVLGIINLYVDRSLRKRLAKFMSAKEAWDYLASLYAHDDESNFAKKYQLEMEIRDVQQSGFPVTGLYTLMQCYWQQLAEMEPNESSDYKKYREESQLVQLLIALPDKFEPIRKSILSRSIIPSLHDAVQELLFEEHRLAQFVSLEGEDKHISEEIEGRIISAKKNDQIKPSGESHKDSHQSGGCQPSSSSSRLSSSLTPEKDPYIDQFHYMVNLMAQMESDFFGKSPLESGLYLPPSNKENTDVSKVSSTLKILSYNVWFQDVEMDKRMKALGDLIQLHSLDVICFQEVTPYIYDIFSHLSWWKLYRCSVSNEMAGTRQYFCMQLSKHPVKSFSCKPFSNSRMLRELCIAEIEVKRGKPLIVATSHLESPCPAPPKWDQMYTKERVAQAKEALNLLKKYPNVVFCGDMNWDDDSDGKFPLSDGWVDAWAELRPRENGWTYDTKSNQMLSANRPLQKRLDRFICTLHDDFKLSEIHMIGMEAIPGLSFCKEKKVRKRVKKFMLPVLPSDHYGLLLKVNCQ